MRTRPLGQLKGEGRVGGGGGEILRCGHKTEFNLIVSFGFFPPSLTKLFVFTVTAGRMRLNEEPQSQRAVTPAGHQSPCRTSLVSTELTRKAGQFPDLFALNMFKSHLNASHKLTNRLKVIDKCVIIQHFQYSCFKVVVFLVDDGGYF